MNAGIAVAVEQEKEEKKEKRSRGSGRIWKRGAFFWVQYYDQDGRQIRESSHSATYQVADKLLKRRLGEVAAGLLPDPKASRVTVDELVDALNLDYRNNTKSVDWVEMRWKKHLKPFFGGMRAARLSTDTLNFYIERRKGERAANATINRELALLHRAFTLGTQCTPPKVQRIPVFPHRLQEAKARAGFVEDEQYSKLCEHCREPWLRALLAVAYSYGMRKSELTQMRVRQLDLLGRTIRLEPGTTKNREGRTVVMTGEVYQLLLDCVRSKGPDDFVFTRADGQAVLDFRGAWDSLTMAAGLPGILLHDFRRSAIRNMVRRGISETVAMKISGHKTASVFRRYDVTSESDLADAARKIENGRAKSGDSEEFGDRTGTNGTEAHVSNMVNS